MAGRTSNTIMRLSLLTLDDSSSGEGKREEFRRSPAIFPHRPKLANGQVYCHRCSGFGRTAQDLDARGCLACNAKGVLKRERFGVSNGLPQHLDANESTRFVHGMRADGRSCVALRRSRLDECFESNQIVSVYTAPAVDYGHKTSAVLYAHDATADLPIECRMAVALEGGASAPEWVMVMPAGVHKITPSQNGRPVEVMVRIDRESARMMQAALEAHLAAGPQRPWFNFDHNKQGPASAWPTGFEWRESPAPGVYARVEWSKAGAEAITGKMYRAFSPSFFVDSINASPARITGAPLDMGALVNVPAFKAISPLWASGSQGQPEGTNKIGVTKMTEQELAALRARLEKLEKENSELKAAQASSATTAAIAAKDEEIAQLKQTLGKVQGEIQAMNKAKAVAAIQAAIARGALPPKDQAIQAHWQGMIEADPTKVVLLEAIPGNPALAPVTAASAQNAGGGAALQASGVQITREDSQQVLYAYATAKSDRTVYRNGKAITAAEADALARAAIYAREISPRLRKEEPFPLLLSEQFKSRLPVQASDSQVYAANSLGTLAGDVVTQRVLELLMTTFPQLQKISTDLSGETERWNNTVKVNLVSPPALTTYVAGTGYSRSNAVVTQASIILDNHKAIEIAFNTEELASTSRKLFTEQAPLQAYVLGKALVSALYGVITVANFPKATNETVVTLAAWARKGVMALGRKLTDREVPDVMRMLILRGDYYDKLGEDTVIVSAFNNPNASDVIQSGVLPDVHGFGVADAKVLPVTENLQGFACFPSALALATRLPDDYTKILPGVTGGAVTKVITEPNTGISLLNVQYVDHVKAEAASRYAFMYGVAKGDAQAGERLCNAATP
jgi:hypothetical protein